MTYPSLITVRTTSSRLPSKCLLPFGEGNVLEHVIRRARHGGLDPVVCTSTDPTDDPIEAIAVHEGVPCFRGSLVNKLVRWRDCCRHFSLDAFHTVDADDPFFDAGLMQASYRLLGKGWDMVCPTPSSAAGGATVGYSLTRNIVERAAALTGAEDDTEMMWYWVEKIDGLRQTILPEAEPDPVQVRLTLDYEEDYWLLESVRRIVGGLASRKDVDTLFRRNPDLHMINWFRNQEWKANQLAKKI